jgi:guanylate kinase
LRGNWQIQQDLSLPFVKADSTSIIESTSFEGKIIIFSAPSGAGKTTIVRHLIKNNPNYGFSVSACTRAKRSHEAHGRDYYFLSIEDFKAKIENDEFVEWEEVYPNAYYGTLKAEIERLWALGKHVIFDVDVQGGLNLKKYYAERALAIFVSVPSLKILEERLRYRNTESEEKIQMRLAKAQAEIEFAAKFDLVLMNESLDDTLIEADKIVSAFINHSS